MKRRIVFLIALILMPCVVLAGMFMEKNGSLEMMPTPEQAEKTVTTGAVLLSAGCAAGTVSTAFLYRAKKKKSGT
ncbi:MAG: hypothetical protein IKD87_04120 [Oscillospiraceae bacterium]|nr:hypothetical protein [Oscillospiraceae bacterium]